MRLTSFALAAASLTPLFAAPAAAPVSCQTSSGGGLGTWTTPEYHGGVGQFQAVVTLRGAAPAQYTFSGTLIENDFGPIACLSCLSGELIGTLDDGVGPGPDYYIEGGYFGDWLRGAGSFSGVIRDEPFPVSAPVGFVQGRFAENPAFASQGALLAVLEICD